MNFAPNTPYLPGSKDTHLTRTSRTAATLAVACLLLPGCGGRDENAPSHYELEVKKQEDAALGLKDVGGEATRKHYPQGSAWAVDLHGARITDGVIADLKKLGHLTELNLSRSAVTDEQLATMSEDKLCNLLLKLDLSHTAITDAGFDKLDKLYIVMDLDLTGTKISAAAIERFRQNRQNDPKVQPFARSPLIRR